MLRYIEINVANLDYTLSTGGEIPNTQDALYRREIIEVRRHIQDEVYKLYNKFRCDRYDSPALLVLGWKTWIQLSYAASDFDNPGHRIQEWCGVQVIVDDSTPEWTQFLPKLKDVMMGGYDFVG